MKRIISISIIIVGLILQVYGQKAHIELTFTAIEMDTFVQLDSIKIINRSLGTDTVIIFPDTTLSVELSASDTLLFIGYWTSFPVGLDKGHPESKQFQVSQNYPNPVKDRSVISIWTPENGRVKMIISDLEGRIVTNSDWQLVKGNHSFRFFPGKGRLFFLTAWLNGESRSIKILSENRSEHNQSKLEYIGGNSREVSLKTWASSLNGIQLESGIPDVPQGNNTYTFQFATNNPCPGTPTVAYEGQVYNTIQIFSQCWLKENLNVGAMINGTQNQTNNGIREKYCLNNKSDSCTKYGGLYQWDELMQYTTQQGAQGICPPGWHVPSDEDWKVLEGAVDSQIGMGDNVWDEREIRGFDAGKNLKATYAWRNNGNGTDLFGFSALPASYRILSGAFEAPGFEGVWWTSTKTVTDYAWYRNMWFNTPGSGRWDDNPYSYKDFGFSVRCLKDL